MGRFSRRGGPIAVRRAHLPIIVTILGVWRSPYQKTPPKIAPTPPLNAQPPNRPRSPPTAASESVIVRSFAQTYAKRGWCIFGRNTMTSRAYRFTLIDIEGDARSALREYSRGAATFYAFLKCAQVTGVGNLHWGRRRRRLAPRA